MTYDWTIKDKSKNLGTKDIRYATAFSGAGGASMGMQYLLGWQNVFCNEIDKKQLKLYKANLHTEYVFDIPIQELTEKIKNKDISKYVIDDITDLDVLQLSPICSVFSVANLNADKLKGVESTIRESDGLSQVVDDLIFEGIKLVKEIKPKVVIIENVKNMLAKKNKPYVDKATELLNDLGYQVRYDVIRGIDIGLPQKRERLFITAVRNDLNVDVNDIDFSANEPLIPVKDIKFTDRPKPLTPKLRELVPYYQNGDLDCGKINERHFGKRANFSYNFIRPTDAINTLTTKARSSTVVENGVNPLGEIIECRDGVTRTFIPLTPQQEIQAQSFPLDYDFQGLNHLYAVGMAVPPLMMAFVAKRISDVVFPDKV